MSLRQIILDTETTGLEPSKGHRIIEIGCVEMIDRRLTGNNFHTYINPEREIDAGAVAVHGLTHTFLMDKPRFADISLQFKKYIDGAQLVIHNAAFDVGFINHEFKLLNKNAQQVERFCSIFDTLLYARKKHPGQKNSLDALCKRYEVNNTHRNLHGALMDAQLLAHVYLAMTGGQTSLFSNTAQINQEDLTQDHLGNQLLTNSRSFKVLAATAEELAAHAERVAFLTKKNADNNLWEQVSD